LPTHQHRSRQKRDRLLKAGEKVFAMHGFADAHISDIVRLARCSIGSFYRRFKDKETLFMALQGDMHDRAHADIDRFFGNPARDAATPTAIFFHLIRNAGSAARTNKGYYRALFELSLRGTPVWERMRELERYQAEHLHDLLLRRGRTALRRDFVDAVAAAIRMIYGSQMSLMLHGPGPFEHNDARSTIEFTRILMSVAGEAADEDELRRLRTLCRRATG
jgi:AcrR family transcriptional regulator